MSLNIGNKSYTKPNSQHEKLQDDFYKYQLDVAAKHRGPYYMVFKEQGIPNGQRADIATLSWASSNWFDIYEIKARREDFLHEIRSEKWVGYTEYCREMVFVTPHDLVTAEEIPDQAGWITQGPRGGFRRRKWGHQDTAFKASYRQIELCLEHMYEHRPHGG